MIKPNKSQKNILRCRVIKKVNGIPFDEFNKIFPCVPEGYYFFKTLDESKFDQFSFYYAVIYDTDQLVCVAPCFSVNYPLDTSINGPLRRLTNGVKKIFNNNFSIKALVCGIPMGQGNIGITKGIPGLVETLESCMERLAKKIHAPIIAFKDFDQSYDDLLNPLLQSKFLKIDSLPLTRMQLDFSNFDEYLKSLSSATRYDYRKKLKKAESIKIESSLVNTLDETTLDEVYELYLQAIETHNMGFEIVPKQFFRLISTNMPQETKFFLWRIDDKLVAFVLCLVSNGTLLDYYMGIDYTPAHEYHLYFVKFFSRANK